MKNDYFLHFTAEKKRNIGKDKLKPGNAAASGFYSEIYKSCYSETV